MNDPMNGASISEGSRWYRCVLIYLWCAGAGGRMSDGGSGGKYWLTISVTSVRKMAPTLWTFLCDVTMISLDFTQSEFKFSEDTEDICTYSYAEWCMHFMVLVPTWTTKDASGRQISDFPPKLLVVGLCRTKTKEFFLPLPYPHKPTQARTTHPQKYSLAFCSSQPIVYTTPAFGFNGNENIVDGGFPINIHHDHQSNS